MACVPCDHLGWHLARRRGCLGCFVLSFLLPCRWCAFSLAALLCRGAGVVPCFPCGLAYGGGIVCCPVFMADVVWACVVSSL